MGLKYAIQFQQPPGTLRRYYEYRYAWEVMHRIKVLAKQCTKDNPGLVLTFVYGRETPYEPIRQEADKSKLLTPTHLRR